MLAPTAFVVALVGLMVPRSDAIGEGLLDGNILSGMIRGFADIFQDVNTTEIDSRLLMGKWHQMYKAAINFDVFRTQMYCPVSYFKENLVLGPGGFAWEEAYHVISKTGPIETYLKDVVQTAPGQYWVYPHQYFYPHQFFVVRNGPIVNGSYQYVVATDQNKLALIVLARDPLAYYNKYDTEVGEYLKEERFGNPVFWNQPVAIYHGPDCIYPSQKEVFARRVYQDLFRQQQGNQQGGAGGQSPLNFNALQGIIGGFGG